MSRSAVSFVTSSAVRAETLLAVVGDARTTADVLATVDASESAVYDALSALERRGHVRSSNDEWAPTGAGQLVADRIEADRALDAVLDDPYWQDHDVSVIPRRLRVRLGALADAEVVRASDTEPYAVLRELRDRMAEADAPAIVSPMYHPDYVEAMPDADGARLVLDPSILERTLGDPDSDVEVRVFERTAVRLRDVDLALMVTDDEVTLSLPTLDGEYDHRATLVAESTDAIAWGEDLFETLWAGADPAEDALSQYDLSL